MTAVLASVQSNADTTIPAALVVLVVLAACICVIAFTVPAILRARHTHPRPHDPATCDCKAVR